MTNYEWFPMNFLTACCAFSLSYLPSCPSFGPARYSHPVSSDRCSRDCARTCRSGVRSCGKVQGADPLLPIPLLPGISLLPLLCPPHLPRLLLLLPPLACQESGVLEDCSIGQLSLPHPPRPAGLGCMDWTTFQSPSPCTKAPPGGSRRIQLSHLRLVSPFWITEH